jgi:hypothetical protein
MTPQQLSLLRHDFAALGAALKDVQAILANRRMAPEVKYDPGQPRAARGTPNGGQWTATGAGTSSRPRPPPPPPKRSPPAIVANFPRPSLRTPLPVIAGGIAIQRAAGTYAAEVSGQAKTPFLHIPYSLPTMGRANSPSARTHTVASLRRPTFLIAPRHHEDDDCDEVLKQERAFCRQASFRYARTKKDREAILHACYASAAWRAAECQTKGGVNGIRTPLYDGHNYKGDGL